MIKKVEIAPKAQKQLLKVPSHIFRKLFKWIEIVSKFGLEDTRKTPGYHDEPLKGDRKFQRSIRLNRAYRAIYIVKQGLKIEFVEIQEVNKHDY